MSNETSSLVERVVSEIKHDIMAGTLPTGSKLSSERDLATRFSVSRITIRAAISKLVNLGFVQTMPQSGTTIRDFWNDGTLDLLIDVVSSSGPVDRNILLSLLDLRKIVEVYAAGRAAQAMDEEDITHLSGIIDSMEAAGNSVSALVELDYALHAHFIRKAGNRVIQLIFNSCRPVYMFYLDFFYRIPDSRELIFPYYRKLIEAARSKDGIYASFIMEQLLLAAENAVKMKLDPEQSVIILRSLFPVSGINIP
jgi:DNA-binding FadR family transcriptional regulator